MTPNFIPVNEPLLNGNEKKYLAECIDSGWISSEGPFVQRLEEGMAQRCGRKYGIAVCNGSAALDLAIAALGLGPGDEVIVPTFTIVSCVAAIVRAGATPILVDSDPITWNMDVDRVADKINDHTRAIMAVHIYGLPVDMDPILELAEKHGLKLIEDAAEVIGQTYKERACGSFGDITTLSFYPNKHVTTGEGGMVLTNSTMLADRSRSLRNLCFQKKRFVHEELGWNFRMSNLQAALGVAQLERLDEFIQQKRSMGKHYAERLADIPGLQLPLSATSYAENIYWVYGLVLKDDVPFDAEAAINSLASIGVGARPFFWPMHEQPVFRNQGLFTKDTHPVAERIARRGFYLPSGLAMTDAKIDNVVRAIGNILSPVRAHQ